VRDGEACRYTDADEHEVAVGALEVGADGGGRRPGEESARVEPVERERGERRGIGGAGERVPGLGSGLGSANHATAFDPAAWGPGRRA
jgi:hypothetical protein